MRRRTVHEEVKMTTRQRLSTYGKLILEARPIWKWLVLSCLLCLIIIACAVISPQLMGDVTNTIYDYWAASSGGGEPFPAQEHRDRRRSFLTPRTGPDGDDLAARRII